MVLHARLRKVILKRIRVYARELDVPPRGGIVLQFEQWQSTNLDTKETATMVHQKRRAPVVFEASSLFFVIIETEVALWVDKQELQLIDPSGFLLIKHADLY